MAGMVPPEINLLHKGRTHRISLRRGAGKLWDIELDGECWAKGRRIKQGEWYVYYKGIKQRGMTLEKAATTLFYRHVQEQI